MFMYTSWYQTPNYPVAPTIAYPRQITHKLTIDQAGQLTVGVKVISLSHVFGMMHDYLITSNWCQISFNLH